MPGSPKLPQDGKLAVTIAGEGRHEEIRSILEGTSIDMESDMGDSDDGEHQADDNTGNAADDNADVE
jgi:hypothetical protein